MRPVPALSAVALAILLAVSSVASADTFNFNFTGFGTSGSGQITASPSGTAGIYFVSGISGTTGGLTITGLAPAGTLGSNNFLYLPPTSQGYFDIAGVTYLLNGGFEVNLYSFGGSEEIAEGTSFTNVQFTTLDSFTLAPADVAPTPEPGSLSLLALSLALIGVTMRKRQFAR